jgi:hypothetical protein
MTKTTLIRNRGEDEQVTLQTAKEKVILRLETQSTCMYGAARPLGRVASIYGTFRKKWRTKRLVEYVAKTIVLRNHGLKNLNPRRGVANPAARGQDPGRGNTLTHMGTYIMVGVSSHVRLCV